MNMPIANRNRSGLMGAEQAKIIENISAFAKTFLDDVDAAAVQATLQLVIGTNVQAFSQILAALAGLSGAANKLPYFTGATAMALADLSAFARTFLDDADAAAVKTTLSIADAVTISTQVVSGSPASIVFPNIPATGFSHFKLILENLVSNNAATTDAAVIELSADNGTTYRTTSGDYRTLAASNANANLGNAGTVPGNTATIKKGHAVSELYGLGNANHHTWMNFLGSLHVQTSTTIQQDSASQRNVRMVAEADNAFRVKPNSGTAWSSGTATLIGFRE